MPQTPEKGGKGKIALILLLLFGLMFVLVVFVFGVRSLLSMLLWIAGLTMILSILFVVIYLFWYLFIRKPKFDITYVNKMKLVDAGGKSCPPTISGRTLYLSGDKGHSRVPFGIIIGYARIQILTRMLSINKETKSPETRKNPRTGEIEPIYIIGKEEQDIFVVKHRAGFFGLFEEPSVVRVSPDDHDELIGDITLYGFSLLPISEYLFLNSDLLDVRKIDYAILKEAERGVMFESLRDMKEIVDKATGLDSYHIKDLEKKNMYEIPQMQNVGN